MKEVDLIVHKIGQDDEHALSQFIDCYSTHLYHYAFGILQNKEWAEEVVSDVFFEVWDKRKTLASVDNINGWLHTILYNKAISYLRKEKVRSSLPLDDFENFNFEIVESKEDELIKAEDIARLNKAIASLSPKRRHVLYLVKIEKLSYLEISNMLGISVKTISNHITAAMEQLTRLLKDSSLVLWLFLAGRLC